MKCSPIWLLKEWISPPAHFREYGLQYGMNNTLLSLWGVDRPCEEPVSSLTQSSTMTSVAPRDFSNRGRVHDNFLKNLWEVKSWGLLSCDRVGGRASPVSDVRVSSARKGKRVNLKGCHECWKLSFREMGWELTFHNKVFRLQFSHLQNNLYKLWREKILYRSRKVILIW